jgi:hypothetical protein
MQKHISDGLKQIELIGLKIVQAQKILNAREKYGSQP